MHKNLLLLVVLGLLANSCCNEDFITPGGDYDFQDGAIDVTALLVAQTCSADAAYTTEGATPDGEDPSCEDTENNRWFKFTATSSGEIRIYVLVGGTEGTQRETRVTLWDTDGTTDLACETYSTFPDDDVFLNYGSLTPGETYYISVDSTGDTSGTFALCLADSD